MPAPPLPDELVRQAADAFRQYGLGKAGADSIGLHPGTFRSRVLVAAQRGYLGTDPVLPGFQIVRATTETDKDGNTVRSVVSQKPEPGEEFQVHPGHRITAVSSYVDAQDRVVNKWVKTREGELDPLWVAERLKEAFNDVPPAEPAPGPAVTSSDLLTLIPCADWHIGMRAWVKETAQNWDLKIAERVIGAAIESVIRRSPASCTAIVLGGGDLLHADNKLNQTANSGNHLDVDGRYQEVLMTACRLMVRTVEASLRQHEHTIVRILPGNHDEHSAVASAYYLAAWFRNEPRVTVDTDPSLFFWHRFGKVLIGATHGHAVKISKMPAIMAHRRAEDWGQTLFRYVHGFHLHHGEKSLSDEGVIREVHQAPIPPDSWHWGMGFLSGRSVQAITYHAKTGEHGRVTENIQDGAV